MKKNDWVRLLTFVLGFGTASAGLSRITWAATTPNSTTDASFNEVKAVVWDANPVAHSDEEAAEIAVYRDGQLPRYEVSASKFVVNGVDRLLQDAIRTTTQDDNYYPRIEKLLHSNGACLSGTWEITEDSAYTGYFAKGKKALFIARASTATSSTRSDEQRGFGFAGKIFPTLDPNEKVHTANFFTVDVLMGQKIGHYADTGLTNEPELGFNASIFWMALKIASTLSKADQQPMFRPLYPISELGMQDAAQAKAPHWMMIRPSAGSPKIDESDFRDEITKAIRQAGMLQFDILVSETTHDRHSNDWKPLGKIVLTDETVSYGCDRQLHFAHPKLK